MQRFVRLYTGTSRFFRVVSASHSKINISLFEQKNALDHTNSLIFKRCLATNNKSSKSTNQVDSHSDLYKPSTAKEKTHVPDDLKGGQPIDTIQSLAQDITTGSGKVWSANNPGGVHVAPLIRAGSTTFVPKSTENGNKVHETTVYTTQGELNIADPLKTHTLHHDPTPVELAEAAAASAFETSAAPPSTPTAEAVFAPKISSTEVHSVASSPTGDFDSAAPASSQHEKVKYETSTKSQVFGGQDTSADSKKHPNENPYGSNKPRQEK